MSVPDPRPNHHVQATGKSLTRGVQHCVTPAHRGHPANPTCPRARWPLRVCHALMLLLASLSPVWADTELVASVPSAHLQAVTELGTVDIPAVGRVTVTAQRDGARVLLQATNPAGSIIGRAETVLGLQHTPLYLRTPAGLTRLLIRWQAS